MANMQWIKCSERLPEEPGQYLVSEFNYFGSPKKHMGTTVANFVLDLSMIDEMAFGPDERPGWYDAYTDFYNEQYTFYEVEALYWMPFPEPPKGE